MTAYYNEIDPYAAQWLRNLIAAGHIAPGDVDDRDIRDVKPRDLAGYDQCHFFAGIGGWSRALRLAGVGAHIPLWTGSCPCQPFSQAGARRGFADERHLWPDWFHLISVCRPAIILGEQVASAAQWLRLVRGDLEALEYAVGCLPVEAASAGADHLRDRYWFVSYDTRQQVGTSRQPRQRSDVEYGQGDRRGEGRPEPEVWSGRTTAAGSSGAVPVADDDDARSQGWRLPAERPDQRAAGQDGLAYADLAQRRIGDEQPAGQFAQHESDQGTRSSSGLSDAERQWVRSQGPEATVGAAAGMQGANEQRQWVRPDTGAIRDDIEWVLGADGKARRVKSGVRLLVNGISGRVAVRRANGEKHWYSRIKTLKGFGNAIDPRPAAAFIKAVL